MTSWTATVERLNPATDILIVKCKGRITPSRAIDIKARIHVELPGIRTLIVDEGYDLVIVHGRKARTLVKAARRR